MAEVPDSELPADTLAEDKFGPPHGQTVSDSLYLWILIPGLLGLLCVGFVMYKLLRKQGERERKRVEKKQKKQGKLEKKKVK